MNRTAINPVTWATDLGFDQAQVVEGQQRQLFASGQDAVDASGSTQHPGDMGGQLELALDNLEEVLTAAGMTLADVVRLNVYTTDVDVLAPHWTRITQRFDVHGGRFVTSVLGVSRLFAPDLLVLLEADAAA